MTTSHEKTALSDDQAAGAKRAVSRRAVIAAGGAVGVAGVLAACGGGGESTPTTSSPTSGGATSGPAPDPTTAPVPSPDAPTTGGPPPGALDPVSSIPVEGGKVYDERKIVVTQPVEGEIQAFTAVCPHQGCLVTEVTNNEIQCPCHGSLFSAQNGDVLKGPAVRGLAGASVNIVDGYIVAG